jgi:hypothetical protein
MGNNLKGKLKMVVNFILQIRELVLLIILGAVEGFKVFNKMKRVL